MISDCLTPAFPNLREVHDLPTEDGRHVRGRMVYRSEALFSPDQTCANIIRDLGIAKVFDLRGPGERAKAPNSWWRAEGVAVEEIDLVADAREAGTHWHGLLADPDGRGGEALMLATCRTMPRAALPYLDRIFSALTEGRAPILIHCTAGKDRTGFVIAMVLAAVDVTRDAIEQDYLESGRRENQQISAGTRALLKERLGREPATHVVHALTGVDPRYLAESFAEIDKQYGGLSCYFAAAGWPAERRTALEDILLR